MSHQEYGRYGAPSFGGGGGGGEEPPVLNKVGEAEETRAIAFMACENLRGTDAWAFLSPAIFLLSAIVSVAWLWNTDDLVSERKGFIFVGLLAAAWAAVTMSKRVRDEQYADLLVQYGQKTTWYHPSMVKQLRGTESFRLATRLAMSIFVLVLFGGLYFMPTATSKSMIALMCCQTIALTFVFAKSSRDADMANTFLNHLKGSQT